MFIRNINIISFLSSLSLSLSVSASCDQESTVFTCDLENKDGSLKACFNQAENSMYFFVDENGLKTVYTPRHSLVNTSPKGEPQLGRRGLYNAIGGQNDSAELQLAILWVLNLSDGEHSLLDIAERAGIPYQRVQRAATLLEEAELLKNPG